MRLDTTAVLAEVDTVLKQAEDLGGGRIRSNSTSPNPMIDWNREEVARAVTLVAACLRRLAPPGSHYLAEADRIDRLSPDITPGKYRPLVGVLQALRADFAAGRLRTIGELIHGELFGDFLDMAQHLLDEGFKDPAAVVAGASLEAHLRQLAVKFGVPVTAPDGGARKASSLNADLAKTTPPAFNKLDEKQVTAWLDLRNKAAHGKFGEYAKEQVGLMVSGIRDFLVRVPA